MADPVSLKEKIYAETRTRELCELWELPQPDRIEYGETCIYLFWDEAKVCLVVDLEKGEE